MAQGAQAPRVSATELQGRLRCKPHATCWPLAATTKNAPAPGSLSCSFRLLPRSQSCSCPRQCGTCDAARPRKEDLFPRVPVGASYHPVKLILLPAKLLLLMMSRNLRCSKIPKGERPSFRGFHCRAARPFALQNRKLSRLLRLQCYLPGNALTVGAGRSWNPKRPRGGVPRCGDEVDVVDGLDRDLDRRHC